MKAVNFKIIYFSVNDRSHMWDLMCMDHYLISVRLGPEIWEQGLFSDDPDPFSDFWDH